MIKTLTAAPRRTPLLAIILAPVALYLLVLLWEQALVPLWRSVWYSDTVLQWRLDSARPELRIDAIKDAASRRAGDVVLLDELAERLQSDESKGVRMAAAASLGQLGSQRALTPEATRALSMLVFSEQDDGMLSAAITAVGLSAAENRYPDRVVERIARIFAEKHLAWVYSQAATSLGHVGAAQPLPHTVFAVMNALFMDSPRPGEREDIANAFSEIAKGRPLPMTTLDMLAQAFGEEPNHRIRKAIIFALAYSAADYPDATRLLTAATGDADTKIVTTAESGLRIIEAKRMFTDRDPLSLARDPSEPQAVRLKALQVIRGTTIDPAAYEHIAALAEDPDTEVAVAALGMFHWLARAPGDEFDVRVVIPTLTRAMSNPHPIVRKAAYGALSTISVHRPAYLRAADFPAQLETGAKDSDPKVRVVVLVAMLRAASAAQERDAVTERGITDPDPYVRRMVVGWLGSPRTKIGQRQAFIEKALTDPDPQVRAAAATSQHDWDTRKRAWPIALLQLWQAGERGKVGMRILVAVTIATPVLVGVVFLLYYMARLLTYLQQRRWRAAAVVPVMATWVVASYGMFMLYFMAGHAGNLKPGETAILAAVLWGAISVYTALGWGMHYAVRR